MTKQKIFLGFLLIFVFSLAGCTATGSYGSFQSQGEPLFGDKAKSIYDYEGLDRNPVIVIPGIFGTQLVDSDTGEVVWGKFTGLESLTNFSKERIQLLSLPMEKGRSFQELGDNVKPTKPLATVQVQLLGFTLNANAYSEVYKILEFGGYSGTGSKNKPNKKYDTGFAFGYDFRRDLAYNAKKLDEFIQEKTKYLQQKYQEVYGVENYEVHFDIVAHSMGGLLSRYYLRYGNQDLPGDGKLPKLNWAGAKNIDRVIIAGTPNGGYLDAFTELRDGMVFAPGAPKIEAAILGTFPTLYQMLPQPEFHALVDSKDESKVLDIYDPDLWLSMEWGLADPKQDHVLKDIMPGVETKEERRAIAVDHLKKSLARAKQFADALKIDAAPPKGTELHLFAGNSVWTNAVAAVNYKNGEVKIINQQPGDGKVTAGSAIFDLRDRSKFETYSNSPIHWKSVTFLFAAHMGITSDPVFGMNMLYRLLAVRPESQEK